MKSLMTKVRYMFDKPSIEEVAAYQHKMPSNIQVNIFYDKKTKFWTAKVVKIDGKKAQGVIITESKTEKGLIKMVNDAVLTYLDFPEYMKPSMPYLLPEDIDFSTKKVRSSGLVFAK